MAARRHECSICMDIFKNPKLIPCHHSFCYKCLEHYVKANLSNGRFDCPMCRKSVELPTGGVSAFQANFYIDSDSSETFFCDICGPKSVACSRCLDCEENLCQTCCYVHEKLKASRHHKISDLGSLEPEMKGKIRQRIFCDQHPEDEIRLVCKDCKTLICVLCKAIKHDHHTSETVSAAAAEVKKNIQIKMNQCSDKVRRITDSEREADALDKKIIDAERKEIKALEDQRLQLIKVIDQEVAKMKDKIQNVYKDLRQQNAALKRDMKEELKKCSTANDNARQIIDQETDIDIIMKGSDLEQLLSTAMAETVRKPMTRMEKDLFSPVEIKVRELIPFIGIMRNSTELSLDKVKVEISKNNAVATSRIFIQQKIRKLLEHKGFSQLVFPTSMCAIKPDKVTDICSVLSVVRASSKDVWQKFKAEREKALQEEREKKEKPKSKPDLLHKEEREKKEREEREKKERKAKFARNYEVPLRFRREQAQMPGSASDSDDVSGDDGQQGKTYVYIDMYRAYCKQNNLPLTDFNTFSIKGSGFVSMLTLYGETYGNGEFFPTAKEAEDAAAKLAVQILGQDRKDGAHEQSISSTGECNLSTEALLAIKNRVKQIITGKINGLWATRLPHEYKDKFGVEAPAGLMDLVKNSFKDICKVELAQLTERELIYPVLEDHDKCKDLRILQQELLPIGEKITVYLTYIYNCGYFCVQKEDSCIDQITEELQKDCKTKSAPNMELLKTGQFCAGLFSADKCWTRAKINDIKDSEPKIELLFVDYGDVERVLSKDIRWLSEKTAAAPAQCIKCSLHGIQPLETEIRWSSASAEAFAKIVKDVPLIAVTKTHYDETCDVDLCLVSDPTISISDKLIQQGLARSLFPVESYLEENEEEEEEVEEEEVEEEEDVEEEKVDASCSVC